MRRFVGFIFVLLLFTFFSPFTKAETRALLIACRNFVSYPSLGASVSGNVQMLASVFYSAGLPSDSLGIEDGTIGTVEDLENVILSRFSDARQDDLSILYLCTHGIIGKDGEGQLILSDGISEEGIDLSVLQETFMEIPGQILLLLDACHSGALIGHDAMRPRLVVHDQRISVLTSADGSESAWYYDHESLASGALSYFTASIASGLGFYGALEADFDKNGQISLSELYRYLQDNVASSTCQLSSAKPDAILLPTSKDSFLSKPISALSFGSSLLSSESQEVTLSFTVLSPTQMLYRIIPLGSHYWDWQHALSIYEEESRIGRKRKKIHLPPETTSSYFILQVFVINNGFPVLCGERLMGYASNDLDVSLQIPEVTDTRPYDLPLIIHTTGPVLMQLEIQNYQGETLRTSPQELSRPTPASECILYWDKRTEASNEIIPGNYILMLHVETEEYAEIVSSHIYIHGDSAVSKSEEL